MAEHQELIDVVTAICDELLGMHEAARIRSDQMRIAALYYQALSLRQRMMADMAEISL